MSQSSSLLDTLANAATMRKTCEACFPKFWQELPLKYPERAQDVRWTSALRGPEWNGDAAARCRRQRSMGIWGRTRFGEPRFCADRNGVETSPTSRKSLSCHESPACRRKKIRKMRLKSFQINGLYLYGYHGRWYNIFCFIVTKLYLIGRGGQDYENFIQ